MNIYLVFLASYNFCYKNIAPCNHLTNCAQERT